MVSTTTLEKQCNLIGKIERAHENTANDIEFEQGVQCWQKHQERK